MSNGIKNIIAGCIIAGVIMNAANTMPNTTNYNLTNDVAVVETIFEDCLRAVVIEESFLHLGVRYTWGGNTPEEGFDCSGLVKYVYNTIGITLPRVAEEQMRLSKIIPKEEARPGDLIFFGNPAIHVGIWLGEDTMLHAPEPGESIRIDKIGNYDAVTFGRYIDKIYEL